MILLQAAPRDGKTRFELCDPDAARRRATQSSLWVDAGRTTGPGVKMKKLNRRDWLVGDTIDGVVRWVGGADVSSLAGRPVRLRFVLQEADLFAIQFQTSN